MTQPFLDFWSKTVFETSLQYGKPFSLRSSEGEVSICLTTVCEKRVRLLELYLAGYPSDFVFHARTDHPADFTRRGHRNKAHRCYDMSAYQGIVFQNSSNKWIEAAKYVNNWVVTAQIPMQIDFAYVHGSKSYLYCIILKKEWTNSPWTVSAISYLKKTWKYCHLHDITEIKGD